MKKVYTILTALLLSICSFAGTGFNDSKLSVSYMGSDAIRITIDGRDYSGRNGNVLADNIQPGYHTVKIFKDNRSGGWDIFGKRNERQDVLYSNSIYVQPRSFVDIMINRFGRAFIDQRNLDNNGNWIENNGNGNNDGYNNGYGNSYGYNNAMNDRDFNNAKQTLKNEWFETTRLNLAKQIIDGNYFTTYQIKELMSLFTFEKNKLELAKYAYRKTTDLGNYYQVNDALTYSSSKTELSDYIRNGGR
ncbi:MAG: DUF4476 domain-containing protein [Bacteroidetes bacterium]|nr:DUF4476 domain-containing protein [Bacteroidota bacterium]